jgi:SNF2 family DNA or RNA helicase
MIGVLKRVFPVCKTLHAFSQGMEYDEEHNAVNNDHIHSVEFPLTKRNVGDLNWFMMRYPLDVKDPLDWEHLLKGAQQHYEKLESMLVQPTKITPPPAFIGQLKEFQKEGLAFLCHNERALLADECGLGKTPQALAWLTTLKDGPPWIIVVPPHLLEQWRREIKKFLGDVSVHIIRGQTQYPLPKADVYLIHYLLLMHWKTVLPEYGFHAAIFDEIHEMRHAGTEKYSAASLLASSVDYIAGLSGTPFFNYGGEIWNVLNILEDKILGDYASFSREFCWGYFGKQIAKPAEFGAFLKEQGLLLRRLKEDVLDELPPKRRVIQSVDVDEGQYAELIAPVVDQALAIPQIQKAWDRGRAEMMAIDETRRITGISKAHYVAAFVETLLEAGEPCILYGHHHDVIDLWLEDLRAGHHHPVFITGRQTTKEKDEAAQLFMGGQTDVICVSMRSGTGLNLERARCVVFGELDWSPAQHTQNEDRAHRIGQRDSVLCYYLVCDAGTDQGMLETLGLKTSQFVEIMGDRPETEADRLNAQKDVKLHMQEVIKTLQKGGKKKVEPTPEIAEKIELLERMPRKVREPTLDGFDGVPGDEL